MFEPLLRLVAGLMCRVRVNQSIRRIQDGVPVIVKRRRLGSSVVVWFGNVFLALSRSGVRMFVRSAEWKQWEVECSRLLYPERPATRLGPGQALTMVEIAGTSLRQLVAAGQLDAKPCVAAARELRRAHQSEFGYFGGAWSHGDMHLDNILYDSEADRAFLVDFDTRHESSLDPVWRHGDDLKVFLLELLTMPGDSWLELAMSFVREYADVAVLAELSRQFVVPTGFAKILWYTRTGGAAAGRIEQRMNVVRQGIEQVTAVGCT